MQVLICDDDESFFEVLKNLLNKYEIFEGSEFVYCMDEASVISKYRESSPDLIFMDIELGGVLGFEVVKRLLAQGYSPKVIYVTAYSHYVFEAFVGQPLGFVRKNHIEQDLELSLTEVCRINERRLKKIKISSGESEYELRLYQIEVFEMFGHKMVIHYSNGNTTTVRYTLNKLERQLAGSSFVRISRSVLVNLEYVERMDRDKLTMRDDAVFYVTDKRVAEVKDAVRRYKENG